MTTETTPPYKWFGGKRRIAADVWARLGKTHTYIKPFFGGGAVFLACPYKINAGFLNDLDGYICNFWRAVTAEPDALAEAFERPTCEPDLIAWNNRLVADRAAFTDRLKADPDYYDLRVAHWWARGVWAAIGSEWLRGNRKSLAPSSSLGPLIKSDPDARREWLRALADKMQFLSVGCGDWKRAVTPSRLFNGLQAAPHALSAIFLDPPYQADECNMSYASSEDDIFDEVWEWAMKAGEDTRLRIALCGYDDGRKPAPGWDVQEWSAGTGFSNRGENMGKNRHRERVWYSPGCLPPPQPGLF